MEIRIFRRGGICLLHYDTRTYLTMLKELTEAEGRSVSLTVFGSSMFPFLAGGRDAVLLQKPNRPLKKGDIILYERAGGQFVLHRIVKEKDGTFLVAGDAQTVLEPVKREQAAALVSRVCRKGRWIDPKAPVWHFFAGFWVTFFPLRRPLLFCCRLLLRIRSHLVRKKKA